MWQWVLAIASPSPTKSRPLSNSCVPLCGMCDPFRELLAHDNNGDMVMMMVAVVPSVVLGKCGQRRAQ